jgi:hypothetical protein
MSREEWSRYSSQITELFTGGKEPKNLDIGKDDITFSRDIRKRRMAQGQVTFDIDSTLALFTDLSAINTLLTISIVSKPMQNLKHSVHLSHGDVPLHYVPHFQLGRFGHDPEFDLYIMLPALYNKRLKRPKGRLYNHVREDIRKEFMDICFLPSLEDVVGNIDSQAMEFSYDVSKAKSTAASKEGRRVEKNGGFLQDIPIRIDAEYIEPVWRLCERRLAREMRHGGKLSAFEGFQFFISSKGHKDRVKAGQFSDLTAVFEEKVSYCVGLLTDQDRTGFQYVENRHPSVLFGPWYCSYNGRQCCDERNRTYVDVETVLPGKSQGRVRDERLQRQQNHGDTLQSVLYSRYWQYDDNWPKE